MDKPLIMANDDGDWTVRLTIKQAWQFARQMKAMLKKHPNCKFGVQWYDDDGEIKWRITANPEDKSN
jgi:hypothetical protein